MISKLIFSMFLLVSLAAPAEHINIAECNAQLQGGVDVFPWSVARPFPWSDIQGIWKLVSNDTNIYLKARVTNTTTSRKMLNISILVEGSCAQPIAKGTGFVDASEKNIVRAIVSDGSTRYQLKLALFDTKDLHFDALSCGESILAASIQALGSATPKAKTSSDGSSIYSDDTQNIMLKKISTDLNFVCKKPVSF